MSSSDPSTSSSSLELFYQEHDKTSSTSDANQADFLLTSTKTTQSETAAKRGRKDHITLKLVDALDRSQSSVRETVYIIQATVEPLGRSVDNFPINKLSIQQIRMQTRKEREQAEAIKLDFEGNVPEVGTVHWDGKLLPVLKRFKEKRLPIIITFGNREQILAVPKVSSFSGTEKAAAVSKALTDWNLKDKVQIMCCNTTSSNLGRFNGACLLLEQKLERELILFSCRHHVYELVLKSDIEEKVTSNTNNAFFIDFKDNWENFDQSKIQTNTDIVKKYFTDTKIEELSQFFSAELKKSIVRQDYRELIELSLIFLGGDDGKKLNIRPPGGINQAGWMSRAIYLLKMYLLRSQLNFSNKDKQALEDVCLFIVTSYVKPWLQCSLAVKAPYQDLCFLRTLKQYERIDRTISNVALKKFCQHLWYLSEEVVILSLFDDEVDIKTKLDMVTNLNIESSVDSSRRYEPTEEELTSSLYEKKLDAFVSVRSKNLFRRLKISDSFLDESPSTWQNNASYAEAKARVLSLKAVNDTAERQIKLMQDFHGLITAQEEQKRIILHCLQEHKKLYPDCKKETLKRNILNEQTFFFILITINICINITVFYFTN